MFSSNFGPSYFLTCFSKPKGRLVYSSKGYDKCHVGGDHHMGYCFLITT